MSVINGKAYWAAVASPNTTFDPDGMWTVDVCNLDEKNVKLAKKDGISIKNKGDDRGDFVTIKRKVRRKDGGMNRAPELMDAQKRTLSNVMIGNGSVVNVLYNTYDWEYRGRQGTSADLRSVQVVDLIPYNSDSDEAFDVVEGYNSPDAVDEDINFN